MRWENHICIISMVPTIMATNWASTRIMTGKQLNNSQPQRTGMCFLSRQRSSGMISQSCVVQLIAGWEICTKSKKVYFSLYFKQQETYHHLDILTTTHSTPDTHLRCSGINNISFPPDVPGTVEITLPCHWSIYEDETILIDEEFSCDSRASLDSNLCHIIPV